MAEVWRPTLTDFVEAAAVILETDRSQIERLPGLGLAEPALGAPFAGFGDADAYPTMVAPGGGAYHPPRAQPPAP